MHSRKICSQEIGFPAEANFSANMLANTDIFFFAEFRNFAKKLNVAKRISILCKTRIEAAEKLRKKKLYSYYSTLEVFFS